MRLTGHRAGSASMTPRRCVSKAITPSMCLYIRGHIKADRRARGVAYMGLPINPYTRGGRSTPTTAILRSPADLIPVLDIGPRPRERSRTRRCHRECLAVAQQLIALLREYPADLGLERGRVAGTENGLLIPRVSVS